MEQRRQGVTVAQQGGVGTYRLGSSTKHATSELLNSGNRLGTTNTDQRYEPGKTLVRRVKSSESGEKPAEAFTQQSTGTFQTLG